MESGKKEQVWSRMFTTLLGSNFVFYLGFYMLSPTLPIYIASRGGTDAQVGLVATGFSISSVAVRLVVPFMIERFGRKTLLRAGIFISLLLAAAYSLIESAAGVLVLRIVQGFGFGLVTTFCGAMAADLLPDSRRGEGIGYFSMGTTAAVAFSPALGLFIMKSFGFTELFITSAIVLLCSAVGVGMVRAPESVKPHVSTEKIRFWNKFFDTKATFQAMLLVLYGVSRGAQQSFLSLMATEQGLSLLSVYYIVETAVSFTFRFATGRMYDRYGPGPTMLIGGAASALAYFFLSITHTNTELLIGAACNGIATGALIPTFQVWIMNAVGAKNRTLGSALYYNICDIGTAIGSAVMGAVAVSLGYNGVFRVVMLVMIGFVLMFGVPVLCGKKIEK